MSDIFQSFMMGGFECSTHRNYTGKRIDVIAATRHDEFALQDYQRMLDIGMRTARDGARWHLIEQTPKKYDFSSVVSQVRAARETGLQIIWDLFHYGYPDFLDIFSPDFINSFADFAENFARLLDNETDSVPFICPVNEISFFTYAAGEKGFFHPFANARGFEMKQQLVRATIEAIERIKLVNPLARIVYSDPVVHVAGNAVSPQTVTRADAYRLAQFEALDMLAGYVHTDLGGDRKYLDIIGLNFYPYNEWQLISSDPSEPGLTLTQASPFYKPLREMLREYFQRYERPLFIAETGTEDDERVAWFQYIFTEVSAAVNYGIPVEGICLYPILNHPGWDDDRHCHNGLWDYADSDGFRPIYEPLAGIIKQNIQLHSHFV